MKFAYKRLIKVKSALSISNILDKYKDAQLILSSPQYLSVESLVSSEELPIAMFLTSMKEEISKYLGTDGDLNEIIKEELSNLFKISCAMSKIQWMFDMHIRLLAQARSAGIPTEILNFCLDLRDALVIDDLPRNINGQGEQMPASKRATLSERELLSLLESSQLLPNPLSPH